MRLTRPSPATWATLLAAPLIAMGWWALRPAAPTPPSPPALDTPRQVKAPDDTPRTYGEALRRADADVANAEARAGQHPGEWTVLESLARRYAARARLTGSFDDYARAQAALDRAFAAAPAGAGPHHTQAALHFTLHRLAAAEAMLDRIDAYAVPPDIEERAEIAAMRGDIAFYRGDYAGAQAAYARARATEPGAAGSFRAAVYAMKTGRLEEAERLFDASVRASRMPTPQMRASAELQKATLWLEQGRWDEALAGFRHADALFPGYWLIQEHIAETLALKGQTREAEALYGDIARRTRNPEFMDALAGLAERRGDLDAARAWRVKAEALWAQRLRQFPEAAYGHALSHYLEAGDPQRALAIAQANHAARPYGDAKILLAEAYLMAGRPEAARRVAEAVLASPWRTAQTHGVAAQIYAAVGEPALAARERAAALAINPHELDDPRAPPKAFN